jgi:DNA modification methylase
LKSENSTRNEILLRIYESALIFSKAPKAMNMKAIPWSVITDYHEEGEIIPHMHPCHKPSGTLEPLIHVWTKPGDLILDTFAGSGSTLLTAVKENRRAVGIEVLDTWVKHISSQPESK